MSLNKPWETYEPDKERRIPGTLGVYELGNAAGEVVYIGFAGGRSREGLRGEIRTRIASSLPNGSSGAVPLQFRYEVNMMYLTRFIELLERHHDQTRDLPVANMLPGEYLPGPVRRRLRRSGTPGLEI